MIYVDMNGRCGNQFFQYAFARKLSILNENMPITIDFFHVERWRKKTGFPDYSNQLNFFQTMPFREMLEQGDTLAQYGTEKENRLRRRYAKARALSSRTGIPLFANFWQSILQKHGIYRDDEYYIKPRKCKEKDIFIKGYFEDPAYFADMREILLKEFTPIYPPKEKNEELYDVINRRESVCVSFRVWNGLAENEKKTRTVCDEKYYQDAVEKMRELHSDAVFIVFSNDIEWVRNHFQFPGSVYYEDGTDEIWEKMRMMYSCKHFIMSTSTFCWWAQYLCRNEQKTVISPDRWTNDNNRPSKLLMDEWIKISSM